MDIYCVNLADAWGFVETRKELVLGFCPVCMFRNVPKEPQARFSDDIPGSLTPAGGLVPFELAQFTQNPQSANFNSVPRVGVRFVRIESGVVVDPVFSLGRKFL
jgi:hypothetical protein